jgi:hypothetical protein
MCSNVVGGFRFGFHFVLIVIFLLFSTEGWLRRSEKVYAKVYAHEMGLVK